MSSSGSDRSLMLSPSTPSRNFHRDSQLMSASPSGELLDQMAAGFTSELTTTPQKAGEIVRRAIVTGIELGGQLGYASGVAAEAHYTSETMVGDAIELSGQVGRLEGQFKGLIRTSQDLTGRLTRLELAVPPLAQEKGHREALGERVTQMDETLNALQQQVGRINQRADALEDNSVMGQVIRISEKAVTKMTEVFLPSDFRWSVVSLALALAAHKFSVTKGGLTKHSVGAPARIAIPILLIVLAQKVADLRKAKFSDSIEKIRTASSEALTWISLAMLALACHTYISRKAKAKVLS